MHAVNCAQASELIPSAAVGGLAHPGRGDLEKHLSSCAQCAVLAADSAETVSLLTFALTPSPPPARLRRHLLEQVYGDATAHHGRPWWRRAANPMSATRALVAAGILASGLAIAVVARSAIEQHVTIATEVTVTGTTAYPSVSGTLIEQSPSSGDVLTVHDLAPLASNKSVYEVWLISSDGALRPAAFLSQVPGASAWTAVISGGTAGYRIIAATVEPAGGSPQPSGVEVMIGQL